MGEGEVESELGLERVWDVCVALEDHMIRDDAHYPSRLCTVLPGGSGNPELDALQRSLCAAQLNMLEICSQAVDDSPWMWFQIGRSRSVLDSGLAWCGPEGPGPHAESDESPSRAASAYERALELDPENACVHFALACEALFDACEVDREVLFENCLGEREFLTRKWLRKLQGQERDSTDGVAAPDVERVEPDLWDDERNEPQVWEVEQYYDWSKERVAAYVDAREEQLWASRAGEHLRRFLAMGGIYDFLDLGESVPVRDEPVAFLHRSRDGWWVERFLWELGAIVPKPERPQFYNEAFEVLYPGWVDDVGARAFLEEGRRWTEGNEYFRVKIDLNLAWIQVVRADSITSVEMLESIGTEVTSATGEDLKEEWVSLTGRLAGRFQPGPNGLPVCQLWERVLTTSADLVRELIAAKVGALIAEAAGRGAWERGDQDKAEEFWCLARDFDPTLAAVAANLVRLYMQRRNWESALSEQRRLIALVPDDADARRLVPLLERAVSGSVPVEEVYAQLFRLNLRTEEILGAVRSTQSLVTGTLRERDAARTQQGRNGGESDAITDDLIEKLHHLIEDSSQVQLVRVREAQENIEKLLEKDYRLLHPESQHFLVSAEVFFRAGRIVGAEIDSALIAVEYAKVVETELRRGLLAGLEDRLNRSKKAYMPLDFGRRSNDGKAVPLSRPQSGSWEGALQDSAFVFRYVAMLLSEALKPNCDARLRKYLEDLKFPFSWTDLVADLDKVRLEYRNGAAHTERLDWSALQEFRSLLFEGKLLKRLAALSDGARRLSEA